MVRICFPITENEIKIKDKSVNCYIDTEGNLFFDHEQIKEMLNSDMDFKSLTRMYYDNYGVLEDKSIYVKNSYGILYNEHGTCIMASLIYKEHENLEILYLYKRIMNTLLYNKNEQLIQELCSSFDMDISDIFDIMNKYNKSKMPQNVSVFPPYEDKKELFKAFPNFYKKYCLYLSEQVLLTSLDEIPFCKKPFSIDDVRRVNMNSNAKNLSTVAHEFGITEEQLIGYLKGKGMIGEDNLPKQKYIDEGYFAIQPGGIDDISNVTDSDIYDDNYSLFDQKYTLTQLASQENMPNNVIPFPSKEKLTKIENRLLQGFDLGFIADIWKIDYKDFVEMLFEQEILNRDGTPSDDYQEAGFFKVHYDLSELFNAITLSLIIKDNPKLFEAMSQIYSADKNDYAGLLEKWRHKFKGNKII